jgi:hypothetical protein
VASPIGSRTVPGKEVSASCSANAGTTQGAGEVGLSTARAPGVPGAAVAGAEGVLTPAGAVAPGVGAGVASQATPANSTASVHSICIALRRNCSGVFI